MTNVGEANRRNGVRTILVLLALTAQASNVSAGQIPESPYFGPYLGQHPPEGRAGLFAPDLFVRENESHGTPWFTPAGRTMFWSAITPTRMGSAYMEMGDDGVWSEVKVGGGGGGTPRPDYRRRYFLSFDRLPGVSFPTRQGQYSEFMWYRDKSAISLLSGWRTAAAPCIGLLHRIGHR